jgi:hypothetical protein
MPGWGKLIAGTVLGAVGAVYATNEEFRKALPERARDLPVTIRRRFDAARTAAREASASRRAEILHELEAPRSASPTSPNPTRSAEEPAVRTEVEEV